MEFDKTTLYPIITPEFCNNRDPLFVLEAILKGGAKIVQLRNKVNPEKYTEGFKKLTKKYNALFIMNDFVDLALKYNADGVHIGQEDENLIEVRKKAPDLIVGVSINTLEQALFAQNNGATYVNIGVAFPTKTKTDITISTGITGITGLTLIKQIAPHLTIPYTVIGGINKMNIYEVLKTGARHIAMITAITQANDIEEEAREYINLIKIYPQTF